MAKTVINSLKKKKLPKVPKMNASSQSWENFDKKKKVVESYNKQIETEKNRRIKIKSR